MDGYLNWFITDKMNHPFSQLIANLSCNLPESHTAVVAMDDAAGCADTIAVSPELVDPVDAEAVERSGGEFDFNRKKPGCLRVM